MAVFGYQLLILCALIGRRQCWMWTLLSRRLVAVGAVGFFSVVVIFVCRQHARTLVRMMLHLVPRQLNIVLLQRAATTVLALGLNLSEHCI